MKHIHPTTLLLSSLLSPLLTLALPAALPYPDPYPQKFQTYNSDPAAEPTADPIGPPSATGTVRGGAALRGYNAANPVATDTPQILPGDFELAPGQTEDTDLGLYLDFNGVENFQPIRGSTDAPTDPGPSKWFSFLLVVADGGLR